MKFEAEIIKEIVDSRGHTKTSIHYQSECVEEWVKEVEGAYPKLCDYQPEWLNYSAENKVGVFPYATLTDVTSATVENVVPYAYKSAILKGQTLKNINDYSIITPSNVTIDNDGVITINAQSKYTEVFIKSLENKSSTKYLVKIKVIENTLSGDFNLNAPANGNVIFDNAFKIIKSGYVGEETIIYTTASDLTNAQFTFRSYLSSSVASGSIKYQLSVIEYQDGMENWDIPFFRGMQSVKMPGLTTTGKNLLNNNSLIKGKTVGNTTVGMNINDLSTNLRRSIFSESVKLDIGEKYFLKSFNSDYQIFTPLHDENGIITQGSSWKNEYVRFIAISQYMRIIVKRVDDNEITDEDILKIKNSIMVCKSDDVEEYEPFKSNILTTPSDLELRGIDAVRDELNCLTGQVTQRIGEVVLDGSSDESINMITIDDPTLVRFNVYNVAEVKTGNKSKMLCRSLPYVFIHGLNGGATTVSQECISNHSQDTNMISIIIKRDKLSSVSVTGFRTYLQTNPLTIQYQLATESVKTVDLSVVDQDGKTLSQIKPIEGSMHLNTSGETIKPLFSGEIPVEAITQNLASFIEE